MFDNLYESNPTASIIVTLAIIILAGFLISRLTKLCKLPNVTGYIIAGVLIGPSVLNLVPSSIVPGFDFLTDIAIAFIAFGVGRFINISTFKTNGLKILAITLIETFLTAGLVLIILKFAFNLSWEISAILGCIAATTAPTTTFMTIRQYKAKGQFITSVVQSIAISSIVTLLIFNICLIFVQKTDSTFALFLPILYYIGTIVLGIGFGFLLKKLIDANFSRDSRVIMTFAFIITLTAVSSLMGISPLLACISFGASYVSFKGEKEIFEILNSFTPPILLVFFVYCGIQFDFNNLLNVGLISLCYVLIRMIGKVGGSALGGMMTKSSPTTKKYLGLVLIPQASVSVSLAAIAYRVLPPEVGSQLTSIILTTAIIFEFIGPVCAKWAISKSGAIEDNARKKLTPMERYINQTESDTLKQKMCEIKYKAKNKSDVLKLKRIMKELKKTQAFNDTCEIEFDDENE